MIITTATSDEWPAALALAVQHLSEDIRTVRVANALTLLAAGEIQGDGVFVARGATGLCGVSICISLPGAGGLFWLPQTDPADPALEERLVQAGLDWLRGKGTKLAQALLSPADAGCSGTLVRCGFQPTTRLQYLEHDLQAIPHGPTRLALTTYRPGNRELFHTTLLRTYEGTLDCPELNGARTIDEIIAGHIAQGNFAPERWWLACADSRPVAVALVTEVPERDAWDLSYLGVVPEARRRGIGAALARHVLQAARQADAPKLILAVDERNQPALQLYHSLGFLSVDMREVYLYFWPASLAVTSATSPANL